MKIANRILTQVKLASVTMLSMLILFAGQLNAHEIDPAVVEVSIQDRQISLEIDLSIEALLAGIDLSQSSNTADSDSDAEYERFRKMSADDLNASLMARWSDVDSNFTLLFNGKRAVLNLLNASVVDTSSEELARVSTILLTSSIPSTASNFQFGWAREYGLMVLRRSEVEGGFVGYVEPGELSPEIELSSPNPQSNLSVFLQFIPVGFDHILPKGLDHILFVIGLFLFSTKLKPLLWQVTAFTAAHTITLALASLKIVTVSGSIVEPLIAISIAYVAFENILTPNFKPWRPALIFAFGLLHGLGFASVLADFGLPGAGLVAALIGFNIGVELGQLVVIALCFGLVGYWFGAKEWYRSVVTIPISLVIGFVGMWWAFERVFL